MKRILGAAAALAAVFLSMFVCVPVQARQNRVIAAQGNPYLIDFMACQSKRGDLRLKVAHTGLDAALSQWLSIQHPNAYQNAVNRSASHPVRALAQTMLKRNQASGSCCIMSSDCCPMCPACCKQKSCTKTCCNLSACSTRPDCCK